MKYIAQKKRSFCVTLFVLLFSLVALYPAIAGVPDPTGQLQPFLNKIVKELKDPKFKADVSCTQCQRIVEIASEHFDFREMSKRVLGRPWRKLKDTQKDHFVSLFTQLLQYAYIGKVDDYVDKKIEFTKQRIKGKRAEVQTLLVDTNKTIPVSYIMILKGDKWMVYDIIVEGVSLIRNYMEQFRSILHNEDFAALINRMEHKVLELQVMKNKKDAVNGGMLPAVPAQ